MPNMDMENMNDTEEIKDQNTIIELNNPEEDAEQMEPSEAKEVSDTELKVKPLPKREDVHKKKSFKEKWHDLPKGGKIAIIVVPILIVLIIAGLLLYFFVFKKDEEKILDPEETITIEKGNYKYQNGFLIFLNEDDEEIGKYECQDKDVNKCYLAELSNEDDFDTAEYVNLKGEEITRTSKVISDRYAFVFDNGKIALYDMKEEETTGEYELIKTGNVDEEYVVFKDKDGKYGLLSFEGKEYSELIKASYDYLGIIESTDTFVAKDGNTSFLINDSNEVISAKLNGDIRKFDAKYISLYFDDKYTLYDYKGSALIKDDSIEYIDFKDGYVFLIKGGRIYAYDNTLFKLTETGIKLKSEEYRPSYVFDNKNNYKETKSPYKLSTTDGKIIVDINGKEKELNVYEGVISKTLPYVNYFDGSLFFYSDSEKTDLIGSYTCSHENVVTKSTTELTNCYVAKAENIVNDTKENGYLPIINKKYVFIKDADPELKETPKIVITDIENAKVLGTYYKVDITKRFADITHVDSLDEYVYALSASSNKYGVIEINNNSATKKLDFIYDKISFFKNDYLLVQDDNYHLVPLDDLNIDNEKIRSKYPITDYSYGNFVVNKAKKYIVYNEEGKIVISDLDYVKLESDLLVGVTGNKLNLYPYTADAEKILDEDLDLSSIKYTSISVVSDNGYTIVIKTADNKDLTYKYDRQGKKVSSESSDDKPEDNKEDNSEEE